jgi:hypothetical protein
METAFGLLVTAMVLSAAMSLAMWIPCFHVIDERVMHSVAIARAGHGQGISVFDRGDCQNPIRGTCKVRPHLVVVFCVACGGVWWRACVGRFNHAWNLR